MFQEDGAIRVIEGPDTGDAPVIDGHFEVEPDQVVSKFKKFVREFAYNAPGAGGMNVGTMKYRDQFQQNCGAGFFYLLVNLNDLNACEDGEILAHKLQSSPSEFIPLCEKALQGLYFELMHQDALSTQTKAPAIQLQFTADVDLEGTFGTMKPMMIRDLNSSQVEKLVVVQGIVTSVKRARHKARKVILKCSSCENMKELRLNAGFCAAHIPSSCDGANRVGGQAERCPPNPFTIIDDLCEFVDEQVLKLQELPEHVPVGEMPRSYDLCVHQYLVDQCAPGTRLTAVGVFCATENAAGENMTGARGKGTSTVKYSYVQVFGLQVAQGNVGTASMQISSEEEEKFEAFAKDPDVHDKIHKSIAPSICASSKDVIDDVKKAVASLLFGGSRKQLPDGTRMRGDINILLLGDPGTAKSQFLKFSEKAAPIAVYTSGKGSSAAGLTAAIIRDKEGFTLEGGAMVLADGGIVCIDEFDKMDVKDRVAIHEAMEQQTISIAKAGITTMLNTRCSVLAAANPRFGTYDDLVNTADQMDFETTILSRFDMMFLVKDVRDPDRDYMLAKHMTTLHKGEAVEEREGPLTVLELRKYIAYCRSRCSPRLTAEAAEVLKNHYVTIRQAMKSDKATIPITVRQLEAIIRISESLAKMQLREDADIGHVEEALRMFTVSTLDSANKDRGGFGQNLTDEAKEDQHKAEEMIRRLVPRGGRKNKFQLESLLVSAGGVDETNARRAIYSMLMRGELHERANNTLQRSG
jgi:DNA replication licensing factor MCM5